MKSIKLKSLRFDDPPFRKLGDLEIPISERITLIAGHNGIGKSTILALIANGSGVRGVGFQTYLNRAFDANVYDIVHLDYLKDFKEFKEQNKPLPLSHLTYEIDGQPLVKRCSVTETSRIKGNQVRIVPRNQPYEPFLNASGSEILGKDAKVPLPTIYLGMTRMLPIGETEPSLVVSDLDEKIHADDAKFLHEFIDRVIGAGISGADGKITYTQGVKSTKKSAKHPGYPYSTKCISLGQDSLSAIATALTSFKRLKRERKDYPGGLLVVDELDAGFHPHAQRRLLEALAKAARDLDLQIVATTHSLHLIKAVHPDTNAVGKKGHHPDSVVYLMDTTKPRTIVGTSYKHIEEDMHLIPPTKESKPSPKTLPILVEDPEAEFFLSKILTRKFRSRVQEEVGVRLKPVSVKLGCDQLARLPKLADSFKAVVIVLDGDQELKKMRGMPKNLVCLPSTKGKNGKGLPPEATLFEFIKDIASRDSKYPTIKNYLSDRRITSDQLNLNLLEGAGDIAKRDPAKAWMTSKLDLISEWKIVEHWLNEHPEQTKEFENNFISAAKAAVVYV